MDRVLALKKEAVAAGNKLAMAELLVDHPEVSKKIKTALKKAVKATADLVFELTSTEDNQETLPHGDDDEDDAEDPGRN